MVWNCVARAVCLIQVLLAFVSPAQVEGYDYFPLSPGWEWTYSDSAGATSEVTSVQGEYIVRGRTTRALRHVISTPIPQITWSFWSRNAEGDVYHHGASGALEVAYEPPLLWVDAPLSLEKTWTTTTLIYPDLDGGGQGQGPYDFTFVVLGEEDVTVPAGTFPSYGVGFTVTEPDAALEGLGLLGSGVSWMAVPNQSQFSSLVEIDRWYSDGLGMPLHWSGAWSFLSAWSEPASAVEPTSWGRIKGLFR